MTTMQVKEQIDAMSDEDRFLAAAYLEHLAILSRITNFHFLSGSSWVDG
jgi:hypothetical protein